MIDTALNPLKNINGLKGRSQSIVQEARCGYSVFVYMGIASICSVARMSRDAIIPWQFGMIKVTTVKIIRRFKGRTIYNQTIEALLSV